MRKTIYNLIILDESGSMCSIERATVSGLNETLQSIKQSQQRHPEQEQIVTLISFNSRGRKYHYDLTPACEISLFDGKDYEPDACTPLYDAIGIGISKLRRVVSDDDQVLVTIITDGMENDSHEYDFKAITSLMDKMKEYGWVITYIGANQDAVRIAHELHINNGLKYDASDEGVAQMLKKERNSRDVFYDCLAECASPIEAKQMACDFDFFGSNKDKE